MTLTLTQTDPHDIFESFCSPIFCDFIRNYFDPKLGHIVTSNFKICLLMYRVYTNSSPSYVSSLVTPCSSLQSRQAATCIGLRSSSQVDFVVTRENLETVPLH